MLAKDRDNVHASVLLRNQIGLHARPTVQLTKLARKFDAEIELSVAQHGPWFDAKSVVKIMRIKAPSGSRLYFRATGASARLAVDALINLVERDFD